MDTLQLLLIQKSQNNNIARTKLLIEDTVKNKRQVKDVIKHLKDMKEDHPKIQVPDKQNLRKLKTLCDKLIKESKKSKVKIMSIFSKQYPTKLYKLDNPPILLFTKGNIKILSSKKIVAIVGTRYPSEYGMKVARRISQYCTKKGFAVLSGLALGCDTQAHLGCLDEKGKTIAILPTQIESISPKSNQQLADRIAAGKGVLISEYDSSINLGKWTFINRDRLIAALSDAVIVIETSKKGGTMHTVDHAVKLGKPIASVYGFPGTANKNVQPEGNSQLIENKVAMGIKDRKELESFLNSISIR